MNKTEKYYYIGLHTLFFALLLPAIQSSQLIALEVFKPILLIMPVTMGTITGFLVGYHRQKTKEYIISLEKSQASLTVKVNKQTQELQRKNMELLKLAHTDTLTKLGNRLLLNELFRKESQRIGKSYTYFSIMLLDIDYFKNYNDFYGHLEGDEALRQLGKTLIDYTEDTDMHAIRFGGEEFCILMPNCDHHKTIPRAQKLLEDIRALRIPNQRSEVSRVVTVSIGLYTTVDRSELIDNMAIKEADRALYMAKAQGRDRFCSI